MRLDQAPTLQINTETQAWLSATQHVELANQIVTFTQKKSNKQLSPLDTRKRFWNIFDSASK